MLPDPLAANRPPRYKFTMRAPELALAIGGLDSALAPRARIEAAADRSFHAIQLDAALDGLRPRQLDRSARRELAALLRRRELSFAGIDLWIPPEHFAAPDTMDRAIGAATQALKLASELTSLLSGARAVVSIELPAEGADAARAALRDASASTGATLADHAWPSSSQGDSVIAAGADPAAIIAAGDDPAQIAARLGASLAAARLSDLAGAGRVEPGRGRLDLAAYAASLSVAGFAHAVALDVRSVRDPLASAERARDRWRNAATPPSLD